MTDEISPQNEPEATVEDSPPLSQSEPVNESHPSPVDVQAVGSNSTVPTIEESSKTRRSTAANRALRYLTMGILLAFAVYGAAQAVDPEFAAQVDKWLQLATIAMLTASIFVALTAIWPTDSQWIRRISARSEPLLLSAFRIALGPILPLSSSSDKFEDIIKTNRHTRIAVTHDSEDNLAAVHAAIGRIRLSPEPSESKAPEVPKAVTRSFNESRQRLLKALDSLNQKSTINLSVGLVLAALGLAAMFYAVHEASETMATDVSLEATKRQLLLGTAPKVALGIMTELVATFFLRLYRQGLDDFKYYHNELTNLEAQWLALHAAFSLSPAPALDGATVNGVIQRLAMTERNFILKKGESTVLLERDRIRAETENLHSDLVQAIGPGSRNPADSVSAMPAGTTKARE